VPRREVGIDDERGRAATQHEAGLGQAPDLQPFDQREASAGRSLA
jgi:hypothetical protein